MDLPAGGRTRHRTGTDPVNGTVDVIYDIAKYIFKYDFTDWLVVEVTNANAAKPQFVPFQTIGWKLYIDTTAGGGPWKCTGTGAASDPTKPSDGSATTSDTSTPDQDGPPVNVVKP